MRKVSFTFLTISLFSLLSFSNIANAIPLYDSFDVYSYDSGTLWPSGQFEYILSNEAGEEITFKGDMERNKWLWDNLSKAIRDVKNYREKKIVIFYKNDEILGFESIREDDLYISSKFIKKNDAEHNEGFRKDSKYGVKVKISHNNPIFKNIENGNIKFNKTYRVGYNSDGEIIYISDIYPDVNFNKKLEEICLSGIGKKFSDFESLYGKSIIKNKNIRKYTIDGCELIASGEHSIERIIFPTNNLCNIDMSIFFKSNTPIPTEGMTFEQFDKLKKHRSVYTADCLIHTEGTFIPNYYDTFQDEDNGINALWFRAETPIDNEDAKKAAKDWAETISSFLGENWLLEGTYNKDMKYNDSGQSFKRLPVRVITIARDLYPYDGTLNSDLRECSQCVRNNEILVTGKKYNINETYVKLIHTRFREAYTLASENPQNFLKKIRNIPFAIMGMLQTQGAVNLVASDEGLSLLGIIIPIYLNIIDCLDHNEIINNASQLARDMSKMRKSALGDFEDYIDELPRNKKREWNEYLDSFERIEEFIEELTSRYHKKYGSE